MSHLHAFGQTRDDCHPTMWSQDDDMSLCLTWWKGKMSGRTAGPV